MASLQRIEENRWRTLQIALDQRLSRTAQVKFFDHLHAQWQTAIEEKKHFKIPGNYYFNDTVKVFIHWFIFYEPYRKMGMIMLYYLIL